jgi:GH18 family chitinase
VDVSATVLRSVFAIATVMALTMVSVLPAVADQRFATSPELRNPSAIPDPILGPNTADELMHHGDSLNLAAAGPTDMPRPLQAYNRAGLQKEVFGFAPYWALSQHSKWDYTVLSTLAYFGLTINWDGTWITSGGGWDGYHSQAFVDMVNEAHAAGVRVLLTIKASGQAPLNDIVTVPSERELVVANVVSAIAYKNLDGVNIDFEGRTSSTYPNIQSGLTTFTTMLSSAVHARWPNAFVTIATYTGSASWDGGLMNIGQLAPVVDAMFIMGYDMSFGNMPGQAGPNAPLTGWTYNDTLSVSQYLTKAPASKIILGVPWYGYRFKTSSNVTYAPTSGATADSYVGVQRDLGCAQNVARHWDDPSQSPWASWYSPSSGDPCGINAGAWQQLWYDDTRSLGAKYDLVNRTGIRGMGIWALGYDGGAPELWSQLNTYFSCPAVITLPATEPTTEFTLPLSAGTCSVSWYEVQQYDATQGRGYYALKNGGIAEGFPGYSYTFRVRAHSTAGVVSAWSYGSTTVAADAVKSHPYSGVYTLDDYGGIHADTSPPLSTGAYWAGWKIARAGKALPGALPQSGAVLDGYGGLHSYGVPLTFSPTPYWRGWDIARDFAFLPDGSGGYVLDGYGGLHPFGVNGHAPPPAAQGSPYWGWNIARKVVIFSDGSGGYVMDGYGGLHAFGIGRAAPAAATGGPYWAGWQIARDLVLVPGSHAGYILDGYGGLHPFSGAAAVPAPSYWRGWDIARSVWLLPASTPAAPAGYVLDGWGGLHPFGGAPSLSNYDYWPGSDVAHNLMGF